MTTTTLDNLLAQARGLTETRRQLASLEQEQKEQADRQLQEGIWDALERLLPAPLLEFAHFEVDTREYHIREVYVTLNLDTIQAAPIEFRLGRASDDAPWALKTKWGNDNAGYIIGAYWHVRWAKYDGGGWYAERSPLYNCHITTDIVEALSYALDAWPAYDAACTEMMRRNEAGEAPKRASAPTPTPGQALLLALDTYIQRHFEDRPEEEY
jgi:hypothetical protein